MIGTFFLCIPLEALKRILFIMLFGLPLFVGAQEITERKHAITASLGGALALRTFLVSDDTVKDVSRNGSAVIGLSYDYYIKDRLTLGGSLAYQHFNLSLFDSIGGNLLESGSVHRAYAGVRLLYDLDNYDHMDFYCGLKLGYILFITGDISGPQAFRSEIEQSQNGGRPAFGLIPLGFRYRGNNHLGICLESSLGVPTAVSVGLSYTF